MSYATIVHPPVDCSCGALARRRHGEAPADASVTETGPCVVVGPIVGEYVHVDNDNTYDVRLSYEFCSPVRAVLCVDPDQPRPARSARSADEPVRDGHGRRGSTLGSYGDTVRERTPDRPVTFELWALKPGQRYRARVFTAHPDAAPGSEQETPDTEVELVVPGGEPDHIKLFAVSCNRRDHDPDKRTRSHQAWGGLADAIEAARDGDANSDGAQGRSDFTAVLHLGDQVYCDDVFDDAQTSLDDQDKPDNYEEWARRRRAVYQNYADVYRRAWRRFTPAESEPDVGRTGEDNGASGNDRGNDGERTDGSDGDDQRQESHVARVLRSCSNLMIWDDHDITDDWGMYEIQGQAGSIPNHVGRIANEAYRHYQGDLKNRRSLYGDNHEGSFHRIGTRTGVLMLDPRSGRSFDRSNTSPVLGDDQWRQINKILRYDDHLQALVVCSPVPLVLLGTRLTRRLSFGASAFDIGDQWTTADHRVELDRLVNWLAQWQASRPERRVVVVSGDAHTSAQMDIHRSDDGEPLVHLLTSPVSGGTADAVLGQFLRWLAKSDNRLDPTSSWTRLRKRLRRTPGDPPPFFTYRRLQWDKCSFGQIRIDFASDGTVAVDAAVMATNGDGPPHEIMAIEDHDDVSRWTIARGVGRQVRSRIGGTVGRPARALRPG